MNADYADITSRIAEPPKWWDDNGVPRYDDFSPSLVPNIYADEAVLMLIECQNCGHEFRVGMCQSRMDTMTQAFTHFGTRREASWKMENEDDARFKSEEEWSAAVQEESKRYLLSTRIEEDAIHYGDPPDAPGCCGIGSSMNSVPIRVLEYWRRENIEGQKWRDWVRHPELEVEISPEWAASLEP